MPHGLAIPKAPGQPHGSIASATGRDQMRTRWRLPPARSHQPARLSSRTCYANFPPIDTHRHAHAAAPCCQRRPRDTTGQMICYMQCRPGGQIPRAHPPPQRRPSFQGLPGFPSSSTCSSSGSHLGAGPPSANEWPAITVDGPLPIGEPWHWCSPFPGRCVLLPSALTSSRLDVHAACVLPTICKGAAPLTWFNCM
jgi:hypothetical protein